MPLNPDEEYLAMHCYGYGRWSACYWFIGPEEGIGNETIAERARAFREIGHDGLSDCRNFHLKIKDTRWHNPKVELQATWNYQMSLLNGYLGKTNSPDARRKYQADELGRSDGETCIVELRGLPSRSSKERKSQEQFTNRRVTFLGEKIRSNSPVFVVFYGAEKFYWENIAGVSLKLDELTNNSKTLFAFLPHRNARKEQKRSHADWIRMGNQLRAERERLGLQDRCIQSPS